MGGLVVLIVALLIIFRKIQAEPDALYTFAFMFGVIGAYVAALRSSRARSYIIAHPEAVRRYGWGIVGLSAIGFVPAFVALALVNKDYSFSSDKGIWIGVMGFIAGRMMVGLPESIAHSDEFRNANKNEREERL